MNVLTVAVIALSVLAVLLIYAIARIGRLSGEIQDLLIERHELKSSYDRLFARYQDCAKERDLWKKRHSEGAKDGKRNH